MTETHTPDCLAELNETARHQLDEAELAALHGFFSVPQNAELEDDLLMGAAFRVRTDVRSANYGPNAMVSPPVAIILHHTAGQESSDLPTLTRSGTGVSSSDYITKQGVIYELCPHPRRAWHAGGRDASQAGRYYYDGNTHYWGIEIENFGNGRDSYPKTQVDAVVWRCRMLRRRWPNIKHPDQLFRHRDFAPSRKVDTSLNFPYEEVKRRVFAASDPTDDGKLPTPEPAFKPMAKYSLIVPDTKWAKDRAARFKEVFGSKIAIVESPDEAAKVSKFCLDFQTHGTWTTIALGAKSTPMLHPQAKDAMLRYGRTVTDVWSAVDTEQAYASFKRLAQLEGSGSLTDQYGKDFGKTNPKPKPKPDPPDPGKDIDVGSYSSNWREIVHKYFSAQGGWGIPYRREDGIEVARVADEKGLDLALALALVEQESFCRRVMGCDHGSRSGPPYCNQEATRERVQTLINGGKFGYGMNGVGLTQLTFHTYVMQAERMGGAHIPRYQLLVGLDIILQYLANGTSLDEVLGRYNAGSGWRNVYGKYINPVKAKQAAWKTRLK